MQVGEGAALLAGVPRRWWWGGNTMNRCAVELEGGPISRCAVEAALLAVWKWGGETISRCAMKVVVVGRGDY
jgi:hypothetical protein